MNRRICDICEEHEEDKNYKVKERKEFPVFEYGHIFHAPKWVRIDICPSCYEKLIKATRKELEDD